MVRYRLYRSAVACSGGPVSEALTKQLLLSPLCSEVVAVGQIDRREFESLNVSKKLRQFANGGSSSAKGAPAGEVHSADAAAGPVAPAAAAAASEDASFEGVEAAFCVLGGGRWAAAPDVDRARRFAELCKAAKVPHVTLLSSCWADAGSSMQSARQHAEVAELFAGAGFHRLSIFRPSLVLLGQRAAAAASERESLLEKAYGAGFPVARQFMPSSYREISLDDLVLAMRLNAELCDSAERVERLDFVDMMKIIGKEDTV